jgi:hypothetical protein
MQRIANNLESAVAEVRDRTANFLVQELISRTPVDTSRALSNWRVSVGAILPHIGPLTPGLAGSSRSASAAQAIAAAAAQIEAASPQAVLSIYNSAPYIRRLNDGYSAQAPAGFVEAAELLARRFAAMQPLNLER